MSKEVQKTSTGPPAQRAENIEEKPMSRIRTREETLRRKKEAFLLSKQGMSAAQIADQMKVSERMAYRYIDEYELIQLREWKDRFNEALAVTSPEQPLAAFLKILKKQKNSRTH